MDKKSRVFTFHHGKSQKLMNELSQQFEGKSAKIQSEIEYAMFHRDER